MPVRGNRGVMTYTRKPSDPPAKNLATAARIASPAPALLSLLLQWNSEKPQRDFRHFSSCETLCLRTDFSPRTVSALR
jgi:hypothetical protein